MSIRSTIKHAALVVIFIAAVAGVFLLAQQKVTKDVTHCGLISIMAACVLIYFYNRYAYGAIEPYQPIKADNLGIMADKQVLRAASKIVQKAIKTAKMVTGHEKDVPTA